jgi:hypothetical protein
VLERLTIRERGITVFGPGPETLIDAVSPDEIRDAARGELAARLANFASGAWPLSELGHRGAQVFEVQTVCRALYAINCGGLPAKRQAVDWAVDALPERWRALLQWSRAYEKDRTQDPARVPQVLAFLRWAVEGAA